MMNTKRTFEINGEVLPCPIKKVTEYPLEINAKDSGFWTFYFETNEERGDFLGSLIYAARDKE